MQNRKMSVHELCTIGIFAAMISIFSPISIPMPYGVPMTLQTLIIPLTGVILGKKRSALAATVYILLGAFGLPVFSSYTGGLGIILGPTGGFILSFPLMAFVSGIGAERGGIFRLFLGLLAGTLINYLCGMVVYSFVMAKDMYTAFITSVLPFIPVTIIKIILSGILGIKCRDLLRKRRISI